MEPVTPESLRKRLQNEKETTEPAEGEVARRFMPYGHLREILDRNTVADVISSPILGIPEHKLDSTIDIVTKECPMLLAILVDLNLERELVGFLENSILDEQLPRPLDEELRRLLPDKALDFEVHQWEYFPFRFRARLYQVSIRSEQIVPYVSQRKVGGGGFSTVYRVVIHPAQQQLVAEKRIFLARKKLTTSLSVSNTSRNEEAELLFLLGNIKHRNIVQLLAAYHQNGITNLIFPYFEMDLHRFLLQEQRLIGFEADAVILKSLQGLASGIAYLHNFRPRFKGQNAEAQRFLHGYHHDLKPRNILVGNQTFILCDFGFSRLKPPDQDTKTNWKDTTFEYGPPECRNQVTFEPGKVGRALDIWSLACIFSEVMIYMTRGASGVSEFRDRRIIEQVYGRTRCFHDGTRLSSHVQNFLQQLEESTPSSWLRRLSTVVLRMFATESKSRPEAKEVERVLARLALSTSTSTLDDRIDAIRGRRKLEGSNVFKARLTIERNRLRAWRAVLGLDSTLMFGEGETHELTLSQLSEMSDSIQPVIEKLAPSEDHEDNHPNRDLLITILQSLNDHLCTLTSARFEQPIEDRFMLITASDVDEGKREDGAHADALNVLQQLNHDLAEAENEGTNLGRTAAMKYMSTLFAEEQLENAQQTLDKADIEKDVQPSDLEARPDIYLYKRQKRVLVEWQYYGPRRTSAIKDEDLEAVVCAQFGRIQALATMLAHKPKPDDFKVLDCLGTFHDEGAQYFGLVYAIPDNTLPVRLHKLFRHNKSQLKLPNPTEKLALAKALVNSVNSFHLAGWVHKCINSYNVLFFSEASENLANLDISQPYVVGFDYSRPDSKAAFSEGPQASGMKEYIHPSYHNPEDRYERRFDYYALGLVLLEIGTWNPLCTIYDRPQFRTYSPEQMRLKYVKCCDRALLLVMGEIFAHITKDCLDIDRWASNMNSEFDWQKAFQQRIVERLSACNF